MDVWQVVKWVIAFLVLAIVAGIIFTNVVEPMATAGLVIMQHERTAYDGYAANVVPYSAPWDVWRLAARPLLWGGEMKDLATWIGWSALVVISAGWFWTLFKKVFG